MRPSGLKRSARWYRCHWRIKTEVLNTWLLAVSLHLIALGRLPVATPSRNLISFQFPLKHQADHPNVSDPPFTLSRTSPRRHSEKGEIHHDYRTAVHRDMLE